MCIYFLFNIYCSILIYMVIMIVTYIKVYISTLFCVAVYFSSIILYNYFQTNRTWRILIFIRNYFKLKIKIYTYTLILYPKKNGLFYFWECNTLLHLDLHHLDNDLQSLSQSFIQNYRIHLPKIWQVSADFYWCYWQKQSRFLLCALREMLYIKGNDNTPFL